jgi:hypothetical protein
MKNANKQADKSLKANEFISNSPDSRCYRLNINLILFLIVFSILSQKGISQKYRHVPVYVPKNHLGCTFLVIASANGYGLQLCPSVFYKSNRHIFQVGAIIQKQKMNVCGAQVGYEYTLMREDDDELKRLELFCFLNGSYHANALFGKGALMVEERADPELGANADQLHFKSAEAYVGLGLRTKVCKNVQWVNCIGGGAYTSFNLPDYLYHAKRNFGLILKTGISITLEHTTFHKRK